MRYIIIPLVLLLAAVFAFAHSPQDNPGKCVCSPSSSCNCQCLSCHKGSECEPLYKGDNCVECHDYEISSHLGYNLNSLNPLKPAYFEAGFTDWKDKVDKELDRLKDKGKKVKEKIKEDIL